MTADEIRRTVADAVAAALNTAELRRVLPTLDRQAIATHAADMAVDLAERNQAVRQ